MYAQSLYISYSIHSYYNLCNIQLLCNHISYGEDFHCSKLTSYTCYFVIKCTFISLYVTVKFCDICIGIVKKKNQYKKIIYNNIMYKCLLFYIDIKLL